MELRDLKHPRNKLQTKSTVKSVINHFNIRSFHSGKVFWLVPNLKSSGLLFRVSFQLLMSLERWWRKIWRIFFFQLIKSICCLTVHLHWRFRLLGHKMIQNKQSSYSKQREGNFRDFYLQHRKQLKREIFFKQNSRAESFIDNQGLFWNYVDLAHSTMIYEPTHNCWRQQ